MKQADQIQRELRSLAASLRELADNHISTPEETAAYLIAQGYVMTAVVEILGLRE